MAEHLVFSLVATLAANGDLAGFERRGTLAWPGRSAILGLLGAALGVRRDDAAGQAALAPVQMAVAVHDEGLHLRDYHTVQSVRAATVKRPATRREALVRAGRHAETTITLRDYRMGVAYAVAVWGVPLASLEAALKRPAFTLYLGRKSCPLAAPPAPRIVDAHGPLEALESAQWPEFRTVPDASAVYSDIDLGGGLRERRNDVPLDRGPWHFTGRDVHVWRREGGA